MIHVHPINDLKEHILEGTTCHCTPRVEIEDEIIVIHNSYDGRELVEEAQSILGLPTMVQDNKIWEGTPE